LDDVKDDPTRNVHCCGIHDGCFEMTPSPFPYDFSGGRFHGRGRFLVDFFGNQSQLYCEAKEQNPRDLQKTEAWKAEGSQEPVPERL